MTLPLSFLRSAALTGAISLILAVLSTPLAAALARRTGAVAKAKSDRWHSKPTPILGGIAFVAATLVSLAVFVPIQRDYAIVIAGSAALFLMGLADDYVHIKPYQKLIGQLLCATLVAGFGLMLPWTPFYTVNLFITLFWLVGITNAVNMLDNMDGLAAGVSAIAAIFLALNFVESQRTSAALMLIALAGALAGFLVYNRHPASIFMGDCGSMFVGFYLASMALVSQGGGGRSRSVVAVLAVPVLVLVVPIFDTTFVTVMRKLAGRAASQGGRDHTSHRLVALGLSERRAVRMLYLFAGAAGLIAILVRKAPLDLSLGAIGVFTLVLTLTGIHLARVRVYPENARPTALYTFLVNVSHKRRLFEVGLDVVLIVLAYYFAHVLVLGPASNAEAWNRFLVTLPVILALQLAAMLANGVYRGLWRYASLADVMHYVRGVATGAAATIVYAAFFVPHVPLSVFIIGPMILLLALAASRFSFRFVRRLLPLATAPNARRVVIYGAGDGGELMLRELKFNENLGRVPVAFLDDDPRKAERRLDGLPVVAPKGAGSIAAICRAHGAEELLISTGKIPFARRQQLLDECLEAGVSVSRMTVEISALSLEDPA